MCRDGSLADSTSDTDDNRTMSEDDESRDRPEDLEYDMMHRTNHRE